MIVLGRDAQLIKIDVQIQLIDGEAEAAGPVLELIGLIHDRKAVVALPVARRVVETAVFIPAVVPVKRADTERGRIVLPFDGLKILRIGDPRADDLKEGLAGHGLIPVSVLHLRRPVDLAPEMSEGEQLRDARISGIVVIESPNLTEPLLGEIAQREIGRILLRFRKGKRITCFGGICCKRYFLFALLGRCSQTDESPPQTLLRAWARLPFRQQGLP